jgi:prepilin-type processing-associated H-X9-DG protein
LREKKLSILINAGEKKNNAPNYVERFKVPILYIDGHV